MGLWSGNIRRRIIAYQSQGLFLTLAMAIWDERPIAEQYTIRWDYLENKNSSYKIGIFDKMAFYYLIL